MREFYLRVTEKILQVITSLRDMTCSDSYLEIDRKDLFLKLRSFTSLGGCYTSWLYGPEEIHYPYGGKNLF